MWLREAVGASVLPFYRSDYDRGVESARTALDDHEFRQGWTEGRAMTLEQATICAVAGSTGQRGR